ncbi:pilus assembly protein TadG-related protein [Arthrobacter sp. HLT1-20]
MRRITRGTKTGGTQNERGATAVVTAILMVVLLGFAAISIDVGLLYANRAQLQNGADAAALAIANNCAKGSCVQAANEGIAADLAKVNSNDKLAKFKSVTRPTSNSVTVVVSKDAAGGNPVQLVFANIFGQSQSDVSAAATAAWGPPKSGTTLPWTFGKCVFDQSLTAAQKTELASTGNFTGNPSDAHILLRSDTNANYPGCTAALGYATGGFGWLDLEGGKCEATIDVGTGEAGSKPGNSIDNLCKPLLDGMLDEPVLIPIFSASSDQGGQHAKYTIYGFAAFQVTGWKFNPMTHADPAAPACSGNCRGFMGYFTRFVSLEEGLTVGTGPNLGGSIYRLTD